MRLLGFPVLRRGVANLHPARPRVGTTDRIRQRLRSLVSGSNRWGRGGSVMNSEAEVTSPLLFTPEPQGWVPDVERP